MAFGLVGYSARGIDIAGPNYKRGIQQVVFNITGTASDIDLDIGDGTGTFWTAVGATDMGAKALESLTRISNQTAAILGWQSPQFIDRVQSAAAGSSGEYALSLGGLGVNFSIHTGEGATSYYVIFNLELYDRVFPEIMLLGSLQ